MPSDDLVLNVRQIAGYPPVASAPPAGSLLLQTGGLGSAYASISPETLVGTALSTGGDMAIGGELLAASVQAGSATFSNAAVGMLSAQRACIVDLAATRGSIAGLPIATQAFVQASTVASFNGRMGAVNLWLQDVLKAGGAPIFSPRFFGAPMADTPAPNTCNTRLATTAFVHGTAAQYVCGLLKDHAFVFTFNGRTGDVVLTAQDIIDAGATLPFAPLDSPNFSGNPTAPTAAAGTSDGQIATTAFVMAAVSDSTTGVISFNTRTGLVTLTAADVAAAGGALLASPIFTGTPQAPTATVGTNSPQLATTAFVAAAVAAAGYAPLASPAFTGTPTAPTADVGVATTQIATTAFVQAAIAAVSAGVVSFNGRSGVVTLIANDISAAGGAVLASPAFTGTPTAPTAALGTSTTQIATTAFVAAAGYAPINSPAFTGTPQAPTATPGTSTTQLATTAYVMAAIGAAGYAPINSPALTGAPTAPTAVPGTNTTQLATCAFVQAAIAAGVAGVSTFNGRSGAVTLIANDISGAGGALLASPAFSGAPTAPTATPGTSTTQLATTAYVMAALPAASTAAPLMNGTAAAGSSLAWSRGDHVHPTDTSRYSATNPSGFQTAAQVTASLANYLPLAGGTLTGNVNGTTIALTGNLSAPGASFSTNLITAGATINGALSVSTGPTSMIAIANGTFVQLNGGTAPSLGANFLMSSGGLSGLAFEFQWAGAVLGAFDYSGNWVITGIGSMPGGGPWAASSDARIKTVERDYRMGLAEILELQPVVYRYRGNDSLVAGGPSPNASVTDKRFVGLVAQEVEDVFPGMVTKRAGFIDGQPVDDLRDLNANELIYAVVNAIKQLASRLQTLEARA